MKSQDVKLLHVVNVVARLDTRFVLLEHPSASAKQRPRIQIPERVLKGKNPDRAAAQWCLSSVTGVTFRLDAFSRVTERPIESKDKLHHVYIVDLTQDDAERMIAQEPGVRIHLNEVKQMRRYATENKIRTGNSLVLISMACDLQTSRVQSILTAGTEDGANFVPVEA